MGWALSCSSSWPWHTLPRPSPRPLHLVVCTRRLYHDHGCLFACTSCTHDTIVRRRSDVQRAGQRALWLARARAAITSSAATQPTRGRSLQGRRGSSKCQGPAGRPYVLQGGLDFDFGILTMFSKQNVIKNNSTNTNNTAF